MSLIKPLSRLRPGETGFVIDLPDGDFSWDLFEMGVIPGESIVVKRNDQELGIMEIKVRNGIMLIPLRVAEAVRTNSINLHEVCLN